jgi:hypothetical protein
MKCEIKVEIQAQPDNETCGPTCLHALYRYYGKEYPLKQVISEIHRLDSGGTLAEILACHALERGFDATIYTFHLQMFDPTWFHTDGLVHDPEDLVGRLEQQLSSKPGDKRLRVATRAYKTFLSRGGKLKMVDLTPALIRSYIVEGTPILTGLSSTFLYRTAREIGETCEDDDVRGEPQGHFVMLVGWDSEAREVLVCDPLDPNPPFHTAKYRLDIDRLVNAILLGILTYDANLLVITPKEKVDLSSKMVRETARPAVKASEKVKPGKNRGGRRKGLKAERL